MLYRQMIIAVPLCFVTLSFLWLRLRLFLFNLRPRKRDVSCQRGACSCGSLRIGASRHAVFCVQCPPPSRFAALLLLLPALFSRSALLLRAKWRAAQCSATRA